MIEKLKKLQDNILLNIKLDFKREFYENFDLSKNGPTAIIGERGVGKTYFTLQKIKESKKKTFYFSADNPLVKGIGIFELTQKLYFDYKVRFLAIDEIHKGTDWIKELKSIIDSFPDMDLIVLGSSSLDIYKGTSDLQRRIYNYHMPTFSFGEFLQFHNKKFLKSLSFEELINNHKEIAFDLSDDINLSDFKNYLTYGFYPYSKTKESIYHDLLLKNLQKVILEDLPTFMNMNTSSLSKAEKLFYYISNTSPSDLNYKGLGKRLDISKDLLETIIVYLDKIGVLNLALRSNRLNDIMRKEFKVFLGNPNIYYAYSSNPNIGTIRESFVLSSLKKVNKNNKMPSNIILPNYGDFVIDYNDKKYLFEVGGSKKTNKQIKGIENSYIVSDDIIIGEDNKIPLWMFGLVR